MLEHVDTVMSFVVVMLLLSLLVTTLVQMVIAVTGLRSSVLQAGLKRLIIQAFPNMPPADADKVALAVLKHPMLEHVNGRRATSIRKEELLRLLEDLAHRTSGLGFTEEQVFLDAKAGLNVIKAVMQKPEFADAGKALKEAMEKQFPTQAAELRSLVDKTLLDASSAAQEITSWFDTVMDRTTENFLAKTRWITAGVALLLAFGLHVDSLAIIRQLASQPELRAKLVQSADATLRKAEGAFAQSAEEKALGSASIAMVKAELTNNPAVQVLTNMPLNLLTRGAGEAWLRDRLGAAASADRDAILAAYHSRFEENTKVWLSDLRHTALDISTNLTQSDLAIIPSPTPAFSTYFSERGHLLGTIMTVFFLSLGAPFWYNALRQLANLRPSVAQKIDSKSLAGR